MPSADEFTTITAHHEGEWTEEDLQEIEDFKDYIRSKKRKRREGKPKMKKERDYEYIKGLAFIGVCALVLVLVFLWLDGRHEPEPVKYEYGAGYEFIRLTGVTFDNSAGESRQEL